MRRCTLLPKRTTRQLTCSISNPSTTYLQWEIAVQTWTILCQLLLKYEPSSESVVSTLVCPNLKTACIMEKTMFDTHTAKLVDVSAVLTLHWMIPWSRSLNSKGGIWQRR